MKKIPNSKLICIVYGAAWAMLLFLAGPRCAIPQPLRLPTPRTWRQAGY